MFGTLETASQPLPYLIRAYNREVPAKFPCKGGFSSMGRPAKDNNHGPSREKTPAAAVVSARLRIPRSGVIALQKIQIALPLLLFPVTLPALAANQVRPFHRAITNAAPVFFSFAAPTTAFLPCISDFLHSTITSAHVVGGASHLVLQRAKVLANWSQNNGSRKGYTSSNQPFGYSCWPEKQSIFAGCCSRSSPKGKTRMSELHLNPGGDCWQRNQHRQESALRRRQQVDLNSAAPLRLRLRLQPNFLTKSFSYLRTLHAIRYLIFDSGKCFYIRSV